MIWMTHWYQIRIVGYEKIQEWLWFLRMADSTSLSSTILLKIEISIQHGTVDNHQHFHSFQGSRIGTWHDTVITAAHHLIRNPFHNFKRLCFRNLPMEKSEWIKLDITVKWCNGWNLMELLTDETFGGTRIGSLSILHFPIIFYRIILERSAKKKKIRKWRINWGKLTKGNEIVPDVEQLVETLWGYLGPGNQENNSHRKRRFIHDFFHETQQRGLFRGTATSSSSA